MDVVVHVVRAFNDAINARDIDRLRALMADDHRFVDTAGSEVKGRDACVKAWRSLFASFPDYRNVFDEVRDDGRGEVTAVGRSECSDPRLAGPARWTATVISGRVLRWQVHDVDA